MGCKKKLIKLPTGARGAAGVDAVFGNIPKNFSTQYVGTLSELNIDFPSGLGVGKWVKWAVANGGNGTIVDVRGKYIACYDERSVEYDQQAILGSNIKNLTADQNGLHNHDVVNAPHKHTAATTALSHTINDPQHQHPIQDQAHDHSISIPDIQNHVHVDISIDQSKTFGDPTISTAIRATGAFSTDGLTPNPFFGGGDRRPVLNSTNFGGAPIGMQPAGGHNFSGSNSATIQPSITGINTTDSQSTGITIDDHASQSIVTDEFIVISTVSNSGLGADIDIRPDTIVFALVVKLID